MNICMKCGKTFEEPEREMDDVGYTFSICPYCEGDNFTSAEVCPFTSVYIPSGQVVAQSVRARINSQLEDIIMNEFGENQDHL